MPRHVKQSEFKELNLQPQVDHRKQRPTCESVTHQPDDTRGQTAVATLHDLTTAPAGVLFRTEGLLPFEAQQGF